MIIVTKDSQLRLWNADRNSEERSWSGEWMYAECDPNSPNRTAGVTWPGRFRLVDHRQAGFAADVDLKALSDKLEKMLFLCWRPDSSYVAVGTKSDAVQMLDLRKSELSLGNSMAASTEVNQMCWTVGGEAFLQAEGTSPGRIAVSRGVDLASGPMFSVVAHQSATVALCRDPTGRYVASGGADCFLNIWDARSLGCIWSCGPGTQPVTSCSFSSDGSLLAWGSGGPAGESQVSVFGVDTKQSYLQHQCGSAATMLRFHPTMPTLALAVADCSREGSFVQFLKLGS